ncbi:fluoride efflux transporter CrcB [Paracoccus aerodenitrificans]|uniref:fluoride efflux transporter CrcB n=1 Tax=Paracoccus aerodenitrificans TaxID=3017781 RepID=UPI0022EFD8CE|nr:fluoride efflux transporter CrcB [Paracoccus aerodenitrificans]WBU64964.1 fluoride efflux transporter CrcB [Paracoccus aerodenitrificans]
MNNFLQVAIGGAAGASARYAVNIAAMRMAGPGFPVGTLTVNIVGSFAMGLLAVLLAERGGQHLAPLLLTGILGGFTTFSAFSLDTLTLWERGQTGLAAGYVVASVLLSLAAIIAGLALGRAVFA